MTEAEGKLWSKLRGRKLQGHRFRRQHPIGSYIADFICLEAKLIIELDGAQHAEELQAYKDRDRTIWLEKAGYRVLRFWNGDVSEYKDRAAVLDAIAYALSGAVPPSVCRGLMTAASTFPLKGGR